MSSHLDYFSDLLTEGEKIGATVAGPGAPDGNTDTWYQLATTETQILSVRLEKSSSGNYQPVQRHVGPKSAIQINRYAKTATTVARLEIIGLADPITIVNIDRQDIFPMVEPFIVSWGGRLGGTGTTPPTQPVIPGTQFDEKKLMLVGIGLLGITIFFCGCAGILGSVIAFTQGQP